MKKRYEARKGGVNSHLQGSESREIGLRKSKIFVSQMLI